MKAALPIIVLMVGGCSTLKEMERKGLDYNEILAIEKSEWGPADNLYWIKDSAQMGVPVDAQPVKISDMKCRRNRWHRLAYNCTYSIEYLTSDGKMGTYRPFGRTFFKDDTGKWTHGIIVT